jgi:hypothetical protein
MISIIVCSRSLSLFKVFELSLASSIGVIYELIRIDNESNQYSICEAYNQGVRRSKYEHLCFCHEDIVFNTTDWGVKVLAHLLYPSVGLIGVAGSDTFSSVPSSWWIQSSYNRIAINIKQGLLSVTEEFKIYAYRNSIDLSKSTYTVCKNVSETKKTKVVTLDGLWFSARKEVFKNCEFDETLLTGFHGYDTDISLSVNQFYDNYVVGDILLEHKSIGQLNHSWVDATLAVAKKWKVQDIISVNELTACQKASYKSAALFSFCNTLGRLCYDTTFFRKVIKEHYKLNWLFCNFKISGVLIVYFILGKTGTNILQKYLILNHKWRNLWK